jgi:dienelactone hydrolase
MPRRLRRLVRHVRAFSRAAWPGAAAGTVLTTLLFMAGLASSLRSGLGRLADLAIVLIVSALGIAALGLVGILLRAVLRAWPPLFAGALIGSFAFLMIVLSLLDAGGEVGIVVGGAIVVLGAALGGTVAGVAGGPDMPRPRRVVAAALLVVVAAGWLALAVWLRHPGVDPEVARYPSGPAPAAAPLAADDPSRKGGATVGYLTYGSGTDRRRPEYGRGAAFTTEPVDASRWLHGLVGWKAVVRRWYWGFGAEALPLNARVFYPEGPGPFPLVLVVHGNHRMEEPSDAGYAYLGEVLASRGFIVASVDHNFLNRSWSGDLGGDVATRGLLLLHHLAAWRRWNDTPGHPFHRRVDMERIALVGHSRGGEAVAYAAAFNRLPCLPDDCAVRFDFGFSIRAIAALAPVDDDYDPANQPVPIEGVSYLVLHGSHDGDVATFEGLRAFRRARVPGEGFKAAVYVYRANHSQFNTVWGNDDVGTPFSAFTIHRSLLTEEEQRRVAQVFVGGFLEATLHGRRAYRPLFADPRAAVGTLPDTTYFTQVEDAGFKVVADYAGGLDLTRGILPGSAMAGENLSVWRHAQVKSRVDWPFRVVAVHLGWRRAATAGTPRYRITLPEATAAAWRLDADSRLVFMVADAAEESQAPIDFTVEIATADGVVSRVPVSRIAPLPPMPRVRFTKWGLLDRAFYHRDAEPVFRSYELPLSWFAAPGFQPGRIREVRLVFDRTPAGLIAVNEVGFSVAPSGS